MTDAIAALVQFAPGLVKVAGELVSATDTAKRNTQLIEFQKALIGLQSLIASVQQENTTLRGQKNDAEDELKRMKDWDAQKRRYKLAAPFSGCMVYALQKSMSEGEPAHYLCAACFQKGQRSILQSAEVRTKNGGLDNSAFVCSACGSKASTAYTNAIAPQYAEEIAPEA